MASNFPDLDQTSPQTEPSEDDETEESYSDNPYYETHLKGVEYAISLWKKDIDKNMDKIPDDAQDINVFLETDYFNKENVNKIITIFKMPDESIEIFKCIMRKLKYQINQFFITLVYLEINSKKLRDFLKHLKFTSEIAIDHKETVLLLMIDEILSTEDKFKLSCYFCLEENVKELALLINQEFINQMCSDTKENFHILALWYHYSLEDMKSFKETINEFKEKEEYDGDPLMLWAIGKGNKVAVEYIFKHFFKDQREKELNKFLRDALHYKFANIVSYLFLKIKDKEKLDIFLNENYVLLSVIGSDFSLRKLCKSLEEEILKHIPKMDMNDTIKTLIQCWILNESKREEYKKYFKDFEVNFNKELNKDLLKSDNLPILKVMLEVRHVHLFFTFSRASDFTELLLKDKKLIGVQLILDNKSKIFDKLIQAAYNYQEEEIKKFKYKFFEKSKYIICSKLLPDFRYHDLDNYFLGYCKPDEINFFKEKILTEGFRLIMGKVMLTAIKVGFNVEEYGNKTLSWCFNGNEVEMEHCKKNLFDLNDKREYLLPSKKKFLTVVNKISEDKTYDLNKFLDWAYPGSTKDFKDDIIKTAALLKEKK